MRFQVVPDGAPDGLAVLPPPVAHVERFVRHVVQDREQVFHALGVHWSLFSSRSYARRVSSSDSDSAGGSGGGSISTRSMGFGSHCPLVTRRSKCGGFGNSSCASSSTASLANRFTCVVP